ncbi:Glycosyltransferase involved in cell wall bisynthesis [Algoriphagus locisalis]|uniref:Glycosyltransferase involved in cell wall bisynthesis n=1 Tax=Algoriphagus locisalis TaxID=305507 RepID=A0A1I6XV39_9BACT|nr:glycosyltransferase [Algoriphagus locisalis]SFT41976.1 Glycosyltransferase involved in cell wall bisynthesis [Algoriphagus locisalis]
MKVVRIVSELDFGGVEKVLANSLPALQKQKGLELKLIVLGQGGKVAEELAAKGIPLQILGFNPKIPNFKLLRKIKGIIKEFGPDVVHAQGGEANFHGIWAAKFSNVPLIIGEEIGIPNHHSFWRYVFKWVYKKADFIITISEAVKRNVVELGEVEEEKVKVVYNPVGSQLTVVSDQLEAFKDNGQESAQVAREEKKKRDFSPRASVRNDQNTSDSAFVFVTTCRFVPIKNLDRLLIAFDELVKENQGRQIFLKIIGDGPERQNLDFRIQNLELGNHVELVGFQQDIWPFLQEADAFVLPSLQEGSSVSLAEAMSAGLPSIVTKVGGAPEILGKSQSGILIDPLSTSEIQNAMQSFLDLSVDERKEIGLRAKEEAKRFSVENYIDTLMSFYGLSDFNLPAVAGPKPFDL